MPGQGNTKQPEREKKCAGITLALRRAVGANRNQKKRRQVRGRIATEKTRMRDHERQKLGAGSIEGEKGGGASQQFRGISWEAYLAIGRTNRRRGNTTCRFELDSKIKGEICWAKRCGDDSDLVEKHSERD